MNMSTPSFPKVAKKYKKALFGLDKRKGTPSNPWRAKWKTTIKTIARILNISILELRWFLAVVFLVQYCFESLIKVL